MEFLPEEIENYTAEHSSPENEILQELNRETWTKMVQPRMLSGHIQGRVLSMLSHMVKPKRILEVGTFTGYSALCLAEGLSEDGKLISLEANEEFQEMAQKYIDKAGMSDRIEVLIGQASDSIKNLDEQFDLVFIDADKENYSNYYDLVFDKVRKGGIIIADNVLWSGKVLDEKSDEETEALKSYNKKVRDDDRVEQVLFPIRDGLMICRKNECD